MSQATHLFWVIHTVFFIEEVKTRTTHLLIRSVLHRFKLPTLMVDNLSLRAWTRHHATPLNRLSAGLTRSGGGTL